MRIKQPAPPHSLMQDLQAVMREPAGIVCVALVVAVAAVAMRIVAIW